MGKNAKIIIFSLIAIAVLGGVAAVLMLTAPEKTEQPENNEFAQPSSSSDGVQLKLCSREEADVSMIEVTNDSGSYTIKPSGSTDADGGIIWTVDGLEEAPLDNSVISTAVGYACTVDAKEFAETLSDPSDLAKYGLDEPAATVKTIFSDGSDFTFMLGDSVPNVTTAVYMTPDRENIYTAYVSRTSVFSENKLTYVSRAVTPAYDQSAGEEVIKLTVERSDLEEPIVIDFIPEGEGEEVHVYSYRMTSPYSAYIDFTDGTGFVYSPFGLTASTVLDVGIGETEMNATGMNDPTCKISVVSNIRSFDVTVGNPIYNTVTGEDGVDREVLQGYYGISGEHPGVMYFFEAGSVAAVTTDPAKILSKLFLMPYILSLESVEYSDNTGRSVAIGIERIPSENEDEKDSENYYVNGELWDTQQVKNLYQYFISAAGEELYLDEDRGDFIAEIVYNYRDKSQGIGGKDTVRFYSSNTDRKVIISMNGENLFKTRQMYATQLLANITSFLDGGEIISTY